MIKLFLPLLFFGVGQFAWAQTTESLNFSFAGANRECQIHVPDQIENPPVVFFLHGAGGNGPGFANDTKGDAVSDREKFIAVYPSGIGGNWDYGDGSNDFTFILALIDSLDNRYQIDRERIYVAGFSMGGGMTFALACNYSDVFAAIAPVSSAGTVCEPENKIPVLLTFGTQDIYPTDRFMESAERWAELNECPLNSEITSPYPASNTQSVVTRISYGPCAEGTYVIADSIHNGGHGWPTDSRTSVNQADEAWAFFQQFTLTDSASTSIKAATGKNFLSAFYSSGTIYLNQDLQSARVRILDSRGKILEERKAVTKNFKFSPNSQGIYMLWVNEIQLIKLAIP